MSDKGKSPPGPQERRQRMRGVLGAGLVTVALLASTTAESQLRKSDTRLVQLMQAQEPHTYDDGLIDGRRAAELASTDRRIRGFIVGTLASSASLFRRHYTWGLLIGLTGTGVGSYFIGPEITPFELAAEVTKKDREYQNRFHEAYEKETQRRKRRSFWKGGIYGTAFFLVAYTTAIAVGNR